MGRVGKAWIELDLKQMSYAETVDPIHSHRMLFDRKKNKKNKKEKFVTFSLMLWMEEKGINLVGVCLNLLFII